MAPQLAVAAGSDKLTIARSALAPAGVYDHGGRELTHAHVQEHLHKMLGAPLVKLIKHQHGFLDDPAHPIHGDVQEAFHSRMRGIWRLAVFNAPIEYYVAAIPGHPWSGKPLDQIPSFDKLPAALQYEAEARLRRNERPAIDEWEEFNNLFLQVGVQALWNLAIGNGSAANTGGSAAGANAAYNNAQARICVGDSTTAAAATQTWLQAATNKYCQVMDATYPIVGTGTAETLTLRVTVGTGNGNFHWQEFVVDDCGGSNATSTTQSGGSAIDRVVSDQGTKNNTQTYQPTLTLTIS